MKIDIIIPCYNEEAVISESYRRFTSALSALDYHLIFINDGSQDKTLDILRGVAEFDKRVSIVSFSRNFGHQNAVTAGLHHSSGDAAVIIDADLQDPPEVIPEMVALWQSSQANMIYAVRKERQGEKYFKKKTAKMFYRFLNNLSESRFPVDTGDFRLVDRSMVQTFCRFPEKNKYLRGLFCWMGYRQLPYYYDRQERFAGKTKYTFSKMIQLAGYAIFGFSKKPLKLAILLGSICIVVSLFLMTALLAINLLSPSSVVPGWSSTLFIVLFLGGIQLFTIGILGGYIGNVFDETKNRPEYIIQETVNLDRNRKDDSISVNKYEEPFV